jgi:hypothetical protein
MGLKNQEPLRNNKVTKIFTQNASSYAVRSIERETWIVLQADGKLPHSHTDKQACNYFLQEPENNVSMSTAYTELRNYTCAVKERHKLP